MGREKDIKIDPRWVKRICRWVELGDSADKDWYRHAHKWCKRQARQHKTDFRRVVAILAAMSPGTSWERNLLETEALLAGKPLEFTTYPANVRKAEKILDISKQRDYITLVKPRQDSGWKIGSFYQNIVAPEAFGAVTIDRHAIAICIGHAPTPKEQRITAYQYKCFAEAYRRVAEEKGMLPHEVQAITWAEYRRRNGDLHQTVLPF